MEGRFPNSTKWSVIWLIALVLPIVSLLTYTNHKGRQAVVAVARAQATPQNNVVPVVITTPSPDSIPAESGEQESIDNYIRTIFGKDAAVAIAVQRVECNPLNKAYPACRYTTAHEDSIGIFQINIQSQTTKVHWSRIPGETLEQKVEWLKDPYNNTLMAYWIFTKSGWYPWAGYTSGRYEAHL